MENFEDKDLHDFLSRYKVKPVPDSLMKDYLGEVRKKVEIEKAKGSGSGFPVWMGAIVFTYTLALAFAFGVYWVEGRPDFAPPVVQVEEVGAGFARPQAIDIKIESDAELAALLSILGEEENFLDEQELAMDVERMDRWEIAGPKIKT